MKAADHYTIETIGIPSLVLMERAALQVVETVKKEKIDITRSLIVCGSGNNGGDGIAVGRLLLEKGAKVTVVLVGNPDHCTEEAKEQIRIFQAIGGTVEREIPQESYTAVFDALFGIGLSRKVEGRYAGILERMNEMEAAKVAVDIPSGIDSSTGEVLGTAFQADLTVTFAYLKDREYAPKGEDWDKAVAYWKTLKSGDDAVFDREVEYDAADIEPMVTYGTNPGMGMGITQHIPTLDTVPEAGQVSYKKSLDYMGFAPGESMIGKKVDYVFCGSCTNGRIEDFRAFASIVKGRRKAEHVTCWLVPGSWLVAEEIKAEGLDKIFEEAGFELRQPGCSACLAMNDDKIPAGKLSVSTSNRNFEGRQGPGARTVLASPLVAAAAAVTGVITDPRTLM